jgi:hypothetical protein
MRAREYVHCEIVASLLIVLNDEFSARSTPRKLFLVASLIVRSPLAILVMEASFTSAELLYR